MNPTGPRAPNETPGPDDAFARLSLLPVLEPDATWATRVQTLARARVTNVNFAKVSPTRMPWSTRLVAAALACGSVLYLRWAVEAAASLYR